MAVRDSAKLLIRRRPDETREGPRLPLEQPFGDRAGGRAGEGRGDRRGHPGARRPLAVCAACGSLSPFPPFPPQRVSLTGRRTHNAPEEATLELAVSKAGYLPEEAAAPSPPAATPGAVLALGRVPRREAASPHRHALSPRVRARAAVGGGQR